MGTDGTFDIPARKFIISGKNPTNFIFVKWGASSRWTFDPNSAWESIGMMTIGKTSPTLISFTATR